jgi:DNA-binding transcriptional ArsR family regulator
VSAPEVNAVGDLVLTEPEVMRALAEPGRLDLLDRVRREGPATAAELSASTAELEELERHGLVTHGDGRWDAVGQGFVFELPDDPDGQGAARALSNAMMARYVRLPERWIADDEPRLEPEWARAAGLFNARVTVTADELRDLQEGLERLLEPLITRDPGTVPAGARPARILAYFLPGAPG